MGTYSGYAEFYAGWALSVEINVGYSSDPDDELATLQRRQAVVTRALEGVAAPLERAVTHYAEGAHGWRRYTPLLDPSPRAWKGPAPEAMWSSERRSRGAKLPLAPFVPPRPARDPGLPSLDEPLDRDQQVWVTFYLTSDKVPYLVREVIDGHFVVSQFQPGGLWADAVSATKHASRAEVQSALQDAWDGVNRSSVAGLLRTAVGNHAWIEALAADPEIPEAVRLMARVLRVFLDPAGLTPELVASARQRRQALTLLAIVASDAQWAAQRAALEGLDGAFTEVTPLLS